MQKKGYAGIMLLVILVALAMTIGYWSRMTVKKELINLLPAPTMTVTPTIVPSLTPQTMESPTASIVKRFCENFSSGPPALNDGGIVQALSFLSQKAMDSIPATGPGPSATIIAFTKTSEVPTSFTIDETSQGSETATVKTTWTYASGGVVKTFLLVKENGNWKIDAIQ